MSDPEPTNFQLPNRIQFPRLLSALRQFIEGRPLELLATSTCMTVPEVEGILKRASDAWDIIEKQGVDAERIEGIRSEAAETYEEEGILEINPNAEVIEVSGEDDGQPGAWVQALVWMEADRPNAQCIECGEDLYPLTDGRCQNCIDKENERNKR